MSRFFIAHLYTLRTTKSANFEVPEDFIQTLDEVHVCCVVMIIFCHGIWVLWVALRDYK
jgi:succinate dehydrogenase hydrophobic anchor subunit